MKAISWILAAIFITGCAKAPANISGSYISPIVYQGQTCGQIREEMQRVGSRVRQVSGAQAEKATNDFMAVWFGTILFWPAFFLLAVGSDRSEELARLKGESEALEKAAISKDCTELVKEIEQEREKAAAEKAAEKAAEEKAVEEAKKEAEEVPAPPWHGEGDGI